MAMLTSKQVSDLNGSMVAAQNANLGTLLGGIGVKTISAAEASASSLTIDISGSEVSGWLMNITRSGSTIASDAKVTSGSSLLVQNGATYTMAADDVITYFII